MPTSACHHCQKEFHQFPSEVKRGRRYCSVACSLTRIPWNRGVKTGIVPRSAFKPGHMPWSKTVAGTGKMKAWNRGLKLPHLSGPNSSRWRGGTSRAVKNGYYSADYKRWRQDVFTRDEYTCQACGICAGTLKNAHHIKPFAKYVQGRFDVVNGITLCTNCHREIHSIERSNHSYIFA